MSIKKNHKKFFVRQHGELMAVITIGNMIISSTANLSTVFTSLSRPNPNLRKWTIYRKSRKNLKMRICKSTICLSGLLAEKNYLNTFPWKSKKVKSSPFSVKSVRVKAR